MEDALACVREICFDRLGEMFDGKVPFPVGKKENWASLLGLCHTCLPNWQSHREQKKKWFALCDSPSVNYGECGEK